MAAGADLGLAGSEHNLPADGDGGKSTSWTACLDPEGQEGGRAVGKASRRRDAGAEMGVEWGALACARPCRGSRTRQGPEEDAAGVWERGTGRLQRSGCTKATGVVPDLVGPRKLGLGLWIFLE